MTPQELIQELDARQITYKVNGENIEFASARPVEASLKELLRANKPALLHLLRQQAASAVTIAREVTSGTAPTQTAAPSAPTPVPKPRVFNNPDTFVGVLGLTQHALWVLANLPCSREFGDALRRTGGWVTIRLRDETYVPVLSANEEELYTILINSEATPEDTIRLLGDDWFTERRYLPPPILWRQPLEVIDLSRPVAEQRRR